MWNLKSCSTATVRECGSDWQMVALWQESVFVGCPGQRDFLAFWRNVVDIALVGVSGSWFVILVVSRASWISWELFLSLGLFSSGTIRSSVAKINYLVRNQLSFLTFQIKLPPLAASIGVTDIRLTDDGDCRCFVSSAVWRISGSSSGNSQESSESELQRIPFKLRIVFL